jgi:hypothetical protein
MTAMFDARVAQIRSAFLIGGRAALGRRRLLIDRLERVDPETRGFAFEGAGSVLALLDAIIPGRRDRLRSFVTDPRNPFKYMIYTGAGLMLVLLPKRLDWITSRLEPLVEHLPPEGFGFFTGLFKWRSRLYARKTPQHLVGRHRRAFHQGLGRSLWFLKSGRAEEIGDEIDRFDSDLQSEAWAGVGLAAAYAGGVDEAAFDSLIQRSAPFAGELAIGVAMAARLRSFARVPSPWTTTVSRKVWAASPEEVSAMFASVTPDPEQPLEEALPDLDEAYSTWRARVAALHRSRISDSQVSHRDRLPA